MAHTTNLTPAQLAVLKATNALRIADRNFHALDVNTASLSDYTAAHDAYHAAKQTLADLTAQSDD